MKHPLALIETRANDVGGHWFANVVSLVCAARSEGRSVTVVALNGLRPQVRHRLIAAGARLLETPPRADFRARAYRSAGHALAALADWSTARVRHRRFPHQITLLSRACIEAASLRTARHGLASPPVCVLVTASEGLHGLATALGGPHLRYLHEIYTTEDALLRALGALLRRHERSAMAICTTEAVRADLTARFPHLPSVTATFALAHPALRLTDAERATSRTILRVPSDALTVALIGGWWWAKDMATIATAVCRVRHRVHLLIAGAPLDHGLLAQMRSARQVTMHVIDGTVDEATKRSLYAAADLTIVSRHAGVAKESGLVADAAVLGIPLIVSDHDPDLTAKVAGWASVFPAGDADALADTLDTAAVTPLPAPGDEACLALRMRTATQMIAFLCRLSEAALPPHRRSFPPEETRCTSIPR